MDINTIIVCTTALCRIEIHNIGLPDILQKLNDTDKNIIWIINIDKTSKNNDKDTQNTQDNFIKLSKKLNNLKELKIHISNQLGNFFTAVKYISKNIPDIPNSCMFWLEDDWIITKEFKFNDIIQNYLFDKNTFISLVKNSFCSFPPSIWGYNIIKYMKRTFYRHPMTNPEELVKKYAKKLSQKEHKDINVLFFHVNINDIQNLQDMYNTFKKYKNLYLVDINDKSNNLYKNIESTQIKNLSGNKCIIFDNELHFGDIGHKWQYDNGFNNKDMYTKFHY